MLLYLSNENRILGYNSSISKEESKEYILNGAVWVDDLKIEPPTDGDYDIYYLDDVVEYVKHEPEEVVMSEYEILKQTYETASLSAEDNLLNMDLLTSLDDKLNLIMEHLGLNA